MRISDWSSDVCSSDLQDSKTRAPGGFARNSAWRRRNTTSAATCWPGGRIGYDRLRQPRERIEGARNRPRRSTHRRAGVGGKRDRLCPRSEEHTSELQSLMRISYAVFCLKTKNQQKTTTIKK